MRHKWSDRDPTLGISAENSLFADVMLIHSKNRCDHPIRLANDYWITFPTWNFSHLIASDIHENNNALYLIFNRYSKNGKIWRIWFNMRTLKESIESRRAFQHMANILLLCSLFSSGSSEKGELWEQRVSVPLCIFTSSEWEMAGKYVSPWNSSFIHPFSTGDLRYHPNIFSPRLKETQQSSFPLPLLHLILTLSVSRDSQISSFLWKLQPRHNRWTVNDKNGTSRDENRKIFRPAQSSRDAELV